METKSYYIQPNIFGMYDIIEESTTHKMIGTSSSEEGAKEAIKTLLQFQNKYNNDEKL